MGRRARALLDRRLRAARHLHQHFQRFDHRLLANIAAANRSKTEFLVSDATVTRGHREVHQTDRLSGRRAAGTGNTCNGDGKIGVRVFECSDRHGGRGFLAHRAEGLQRRRVHAEHLVLGFVGVGDETAIDHIGRSGNVGQRACDKAAGARFGGGNRQLAHPAQIQQRTGEGPGCAAAHVKDSRPRPREDGWWRRRSPRCLPAVP
ncbi:MAG: hypothetical protein BGN84_05420 [Afipia sp. 62-7]|nr:MAG: hypothetical protein BGN84_05420 [Afipia sp. 62-7]